MTVEWLTLLLSITTALKYPNEVLDTPIVLCEPDRVVIKIRTTSSNPSHIYAEDFADDPDCSSRNMNKVSLHHGKCGMVAERTDNPSGVVQRVCIAVQLHPLFVTDADRTYCAQCVYVKSHVIDDFEQVLDVSDSPPTELSPQFDLQDAPTCTYSIRKGAATGPEVHYATIGDKVFHVWKCDSENSGVLVQNCHVEDGQGNRILIIDQNGCGVDHYVMATPEYSPDLGMAFQETRVFKFAKKTITRFICQIRVCIKGEDCKEVAPPTHCPTLDARLKEAKALRDAPQKGLKEILKTARSTEENKDLGVEELNLLEPQPPAFEPTEPHTPTHNSSYGTIVPELGSQLEKRNRRHITSSSKTLNYVKEGDYAKVDLVGELRVLDSQEDVQYYERNGFGTADCVPQSTYLVLLIVLILVGLILSTLIALVVKKTSIKTHVSSRH